LQKIGIRKNRNGTLAPGLANPGEIVSVFFSKFVREFKKSLFLLQAFLPTIKKSFHPLPPAHD